MSDLYKPTQPLGAQINWERFRAEVARDVLIEMLHNAGEREAKVQAAVDYARLLVEQLLLLGAAQAGREAA